MRNYTDGEYEIFDEMINKIVQSKGAEIFNIVLTTMEDPHADAESDFEDPEDHMTPEEESDDEIIEQDGQLSPLKKKKRVMPLKPSGVIIKMEVDPAQSDEDNRSQRSISKKSALIQSGNPKDQKLLE